MVVYLDLLFLFNFALNCLLLYVIEIIYQEKISIMRILIGGFFGGLLIIGFLFNKIIFMMFKISGGILVAAIGLKGSKNLKTIIKISSFYIINFATVGLVSSFNIIEWYFFLIVLALIILTFFIHSNKKMHIFINNLKYNVSVTFNHKKIKLEGFLDTGNFSKDGDLPIIYISNKYLKNHLLVNSLSHYRYKLVNISTVNGLCIYQTYKPSSFIIEINKERIKKEVLIVFSNLQEFDCLLNSELFI